MQSLTNLFNQNISKVLEMHTLLNFAKFETPRIQNPWNPGPTMTHFFSFFLEPFFEPSRNLSKCFLAANLKISYFFSFFLKIFRNFSRFVWRPLSKSLEISRNLSKFLEICLAATIKIFGNLSKSLDPTTRPVAIT